MVKFFTHTIMGCFLLWFGVIPCFADLPEIKPYLGTSHSVWNLNMPEESPDEDEVVNETAVQMNTVRARINHLQEKMYLAPTEENIRNFIAEQNKIMMRASLVQDNWKAVLLKHPELDYTLSHPTNNTGLQIEYDQEAAQEESVIHELAKKSGLFFFYRSTSPYCKRFAPLIKEFASAYGIKVVPITLDGISLPEFPNSHINQGQAERLHVTVTPALFAVNPYTDQNVPIAYGLVSEADLKKRILDVATHFGGNLT